MARHRAIPKSGGGCFFFLACVAVVALIIAYLLASQGVFTR